MSWYGQAKSPAALFLHLDKNVYTPLEHVWFTAYLIKSRASLAAHHTMSVALIENNDKKVWASAKFVLRNGLSSGELHLPDSLPAGNYTLFAYTNQLINGYPDAFFTQPVTIKTAKPGFDAVLGIDSTGESKDSVRATLRVLTPQLLALPNAEVRFTVGTASGQSGFAKTNSSGTVNFNIALQQLTPDNNTLHVQVRSGGESKTLSLVLPSRQMDATLVRFYPEGGHLITGLTGVVGWEAKSISGTPLSLSGILYEGQTPVDTIQTSLNGLGHFALTPKMNQVYTVRLLNENRGDTAYLVPPALPKGIALTLRQAVAEDTLQLEVRNSMPNQPFYLLLHNYRQIFQAFTLNGAQNQTAISIPLSAVPKGLATLTLLDSTGRPWAERLFFAHFKQRPTIELNTDSSVYNTRSKVTLRLKLKDGNGNPAAGLLSLACVQMRRLDTTQMQDIESYTYLTQELEGLPFQYRLLGGDESARISLEEVLRVRGWSRYRWPELLKAQEGEAAKKQSSLVFTGTVTQSGRSLKKPVSISVLNDAALHLVTTDNKGSFELPAEVMVSAPDKKLNLLLNVPNKAAFELTINDPYEKMNERLAPELLRHTRSTSYRQDNTQLFTLSSNEQVKVLSAVVIQARPPIDQYRSADPSFIGRNACGDYVCRYDVLNCPIHKDEMQNKPPVVGGSYFIYYSSTPGKVRYEGCTTEKKEGRDFFKVEGIYSSREFYGADGVQLASPEPAYFTTLHWNPAVAIEANKEFSLSFYTGDIEGKFKVIVQGRTNDDVVYGEASFAVKK